jgi:hypothetical protein
MSTLGNDIKLFYTPPKDSNFEELKKACIKFWTICFEKDGTDYIEEKVNRIKDLKNEGPNFISMVQMIHPNSRILIAKLLSYETRYEVSRRLYGSGSEDEYDYFSVWKVENHFDSH